jgi:hypothetical protein
MPTPISNATALPSSLVLSNHTLISAPVAIRDTLTTVFAEPSFLTPVCPQYKPLAFAGEVCDSYKRNGMAPNTLDPLEKQADAIAPQERESFKWDDERTENYRKVENRIKLLEGAVKSYLSQIKACTHPADEAILLHRAGSCLQKGLVSFGYDVRQKESYLKQIETLRLREMRACRRAAGLELTARGKFLWLQRALTPSLSLLKLQSAPDAEMHIETALRNKNPTDIRSQFEESIAIWEELGALLAKVPLLFEEADLREPLMEHANHLFPSNGIPMPKEYLAMVAYRNAARLAKRLSLSDFLEMRANAPKEEPKPQLGWGEWACSWFSRAPSTEPTDPVSLRANPLIEGWYLRLEQAIRNQRAAVSYGRVAQASNAGEFYAPASQLTSWRLKLSPEEARAAFEKMQADIQFEIVQVEYERVVNRAEQLSRLSSKEKASTKTLHAERLKAIALNEKLCKGAERDLNNQAHLNRHIQLLADATTTAVTLNEKVSLHNRATQATEALVDCASKIAWKKTLRQLYGKLEARD